VESGVLGFWLGVCFRPMEEEYALGFSGTVGKLSFLESPSEFVNEVGSWLCREKGVVVKAHVSRELATIIIHKLKYVHVN
jgi:hypothetical protein